MNNYLMKFAQFVIKNHLNVYDAATIVGDGEPEVIQLQPCNTMNNTYSSAKAFVVFAVGMLYDRGMIKPEDRVVDILKDELVPEMDERWQLVTIDMLLRHSAGFPKSWLDIDVSPSQVFTRDWLKCSFTVPFAYTPGEGTLYSDGDDYVVSRCVEKLCGENIHKFLLHELAVPAQFGQMAWSTDPMGHPNGGSSIYISTRDYVKMGAIYLNNGTYRGHRFLSEEWIDISKGKYEMKPLRKDSDVYGKGGMYCQKMAVIPKANRAFALHGYIADSCGQLLVDWICDNQE